MKLLTFCFSLAVILGGFPIFVNGQEPPPVDSRIELSVPLTLRATQQLSRINGDFSTVFYSKDGLVHHVNFAGHSMSADPNRLVFNSGVRKDLELDDQQVKELEAIQKEFEVKVQNNLKRAHEGGKFDSKKWKEIMQRMNKERKLALGAVLLPHQSKRLKQISTQMLMQSRGDANALVGSVLAKELDIDEDQKKHLKKRSAELNQELQKEIAALKEKYREKLIRELKPEQRKKLKEMVGEKFEVPRKSKTPRRR